MLPLTSTALENFSSVSTFGLISLPPEDNATAKDLAPVFAKYSGNSGDSLPSA